MEIIQTLRKRESVDPLLNDRKSCLLKYLTLRNSKPIFSTNKVIVKFDVHSYPNLLGIISSGSEDESKTIQKSWLSLSRVNRDYLLQRENEQSVTIKI